MNNRNGRIVLSLLFAVLLISCAPRTARYLAPDFSAAPPVTLALLPITCDADYCQPQEFNLSRELRSRIRRTLTQKGYRVILCGPHYGGVLQGTGPSPAQIAAVVGSITADGVLWVHVVQHTGITQSEYREPDIFPAVTIYADGVLVCRDPPRELWRDTAGGSDIPTLNGSARLTSAVSRTVRNLFETLPPPRQSL